MEEPPRPHRAGASLDGERTALLEHEPALEQSGGAVADEHGAGLGRGLETGCDVGHVAQRDRLRRRHAHSPDCRRPRVDPNAHVEAVDPPGRADVLGVRADDLEDAQRRARRPLRVVGVRRRDAEQRADAVALVRLDGSTELLDGPADAGHAFADERLHLLWQQALAERRRPHDVGEERSDGPDLVLHALILAQEEPCF